MKILIPQLQSLEFRRKYPRNELLIKFLENNGKNLQKFIIPRSNDLINVAVIRFCPNLKKLSIRIEDNELETLKMILDSCHYLENIMIFCAGHINEEIFIEYSPKIFYEIVKVR